jgi:hypothetical protein
VRAGGVSNFGVKHVSITGCIGRAYADDCLSS